jgi:hypothetical protein
VQEQNNAFSYLTIKAKKKKKESKVPALNKLSTRLNKYEGVEE